MPNTRLQDRGVIQLKTSTFNFGIIIQQALNIRISKAEAEKNMQAVKP